MDGDEILGSTALLGGVDTALLLKKRDQGRTLSTIQRYGEDLPETLILLQEDGSLTVGGGLAEAKKAELWAEIEGLLKDHPGLTTEEIREATDRRKAEVISVLRWVYDQGRLTREGTGKKGDAFRHYLREFRSPVPGLYMGTAGTETRNDLSTRKDSPYSVPAFSGSKAKTESKPPGLGTESAKPRIEILEEIPCEP